MLGGCKKSQQKSAGEDDLKKLKPIKMTIAHSEAGDPTNHMHAGSLAFKEYVEAQSKGKITVAVSMIARLQQSKRPSVKGFRRNIPDCRPLRTSRVSSVCYYGCTADQFRIARNRV
jgi:hypothetical protein